MPEPSVEAIRSERKKLLKALGLISIAAGAQKAAVRDAMKKLQATCKHANTEYFPDASGNNDSSVDCLDCGKELR